MYGQGRYADESKTRSIKVEDINKVTKYDPTKEGNQENIPYGKGQTDEYGNEVTYKIEDSKVKYKKKSDFNWKDSDYSKFNYPNTDGTTISLSSEEKDFTSTYYCYYPESLSTSDTGTVGYVKKGTSVYNALFLNSYYWLGSPFVRTCDGNVEFFIFGVSSYKGVSGGIKLYSAVYRSKYWKR